MPFVNDFSALPTATLLSLQQSYIACLTSLATGGQEYTINGRHFRRADIAEVNQALADITNSLARQSRFGAPVAVANFNPVGQSNYPLQ